MDDETTLGEARQWLRERLEDGARCPCCTQRAQIYKRQIFSTQARDLIRVYAKQGQKWNHVPTTLGLGSRSDGSFAKLRYWGLVEELEDKRDDGGRGGRWRVTPLGSAFICSQTTVPKYADTYGAKVLRMHGDQVSIHDTLNKRFNYSELMAGI